MKKMSLLITILFATASCVVTDLSDLDALNINTADGLTVTTPLINTSSKDTDTTTNDDSESTSTQQEECEYMFCNDLSDFASFYNIGDQLSFGLEKVTVEGYYNFTDDTWTQWYDEQYGVSYGVKMVRFTYNAPVNGKTLIIESFYNGGMKEFLFTRVLYQGDYSNMKNFLVKINYQERRTSFDAEVKFKDNEFSSYFQNPDEVYFATINYIEQL